jgi:drug/metabolite transporter (DMT)-like permease
MRKLSEAVVSTYVQIVLTVTIGVLMYIQGANFNFLAEFSLVQWILLIAASIVQIFKSMTKFLACRYHTASDLQKLAFLPNVWTFLIDVLILKATFSGLELAGFTLLFVFYGGYLIHYVCKNQKSDNKENQTELTTDDDCY